MIVEVLFITIGIVWLWWASMYAAYFLYRQYLRHQMRIILLWSFSFAFVSSAIALILCGILYPLFFGLDELVSIFFFRFGMICIIIYTVLSEYFLIYVEYGATKARLPLAVLVALIAGLLTGLILTPSLFWLKRFEYPEVYFISMRTAPLLVAGLLVFIMGILYSKVYGRMIMENRHTDLRKKLTLMLVGILIIGLGLLISQIVGILTNIIFINLLYPYVGAIGTLILIKGLKMYPKYLIYLKQHAYRLLVFKPGGEVLYIYRFRSFSAKEEAYVIASLSGVGSFLQTTLGLDPKVYFDAIDVGSLKIICRFQEKLGFGLISSEDSPILREALENIIKRFTATKVFELKENFSESEFQNSILPALNTIVEDVFFFYPEKEAEKRVLW